jgi:hypothetical protein
MQRLTDLFAPLARRLGALRSESGYVMVTVMGVLLVATGFSAVALSAADNDTPQSRQDVDRKGAFAAAEAGLNYYLYRLNEDSNFWAGCDTVDGASATEPAPVNQPWDGTGADPRRWRNVPDSTDAQYTIELLPANGSTCNTADPAGSMINPANGTFRIRATGRSAARRRGAWSYRSIVATFRRRGFLDFLYFTDYETSPPSYYAGFGNTNTGESAQAWAARECKRWWRENRGGQSTIADVDRDGQIDDTLTCTNIQFAPGDVVNGPMHTNDQILICGNPTFGRLTDSKGNPVMDSVEVSHNQSPGYRNSCAGTPNVRPAGNSLKWNTPTLSLPPSNGSLSTVAKPEYTFTGSTTIRLKGSVMDVTDYGGAGGAQRTQTNLAFPANGVVYVKDGVCGYSGYNFFDPYTHPTGCRIAYVSGEYSRSLTIAAGDVVVRPLASDPDNTGVLRVSGSDAMLGLVGENHVRVYHNPQNDSDLSPYDCEDPVSNGTKQNIRIDAAILALNYSFMVDYYSCGPPRGNLTVNGVIAQKFRGPVGRGGSNGNVSGYIKNYVYDDRLVYRSPPYFLDPVQSAWQVVRYNEQVPARK